MISLLIWIPQWCFLAKRKKNRSCILIFINVLTLPLGAARRWLSFLMIWHLLSRHAFKVWATCSLSSMNVFVIGVFHSFGLR